MRQLLQQYPGDQALFVLDLDDGSIPFIANVGNGGYGDQDYLPMGPQPVVKRMPNGKDVVYTIIRSDYEGVYPGSTWNSHFGEMVLDSTTVSGLQGGDVRFIAFDWPPGDTYPYLLTDEQPNVTMAGDYLFGGHWEAGFALRILDRSDTRGSFTNRITSQRLSTVATSQDITNACAFSPSHYCAQDLHNTRPYDFGFYIYYDQGNVYDQYWSEYAVWVVSNNNVYFRSTDGAIVALTSGNPSASQAITSVAKLEGSDRPLSPYQAHTFTQPVASIAPSEAQEWAGQMVVVVGKIAYISNNGKRVMLAFAQPHQGHFKVLIGREDWSLFGASPDLLYRAGQEVRVTGVIDWYQGDPVIYARTPTQIQMMDD
ncbi:MAG: hypothetical protein ACUVSF_08230 [Anaerolineae bacterium]